VGWLLYSGRRLTIDDLPHPGLERREHDLAIGHLCLRVYIVPSKAIIAPDQCGKNLVGSYAYPAGGSPIKTITKGLATPYDAVLSR
jgi:hypothetical protein